MIVTHSNPADAAALLATAGADNHHHRAADNHHRRAVQHIKETHLYIRNCIHHNMSRYSAYILNGLDFDEVEKCARKGSCAQMVYKFRTWCDCHKSVMRRVSANELRCMGDSLIFEAIGGNIETDAKISQLVSVCGATVDSVLKGHTHLAHALLSGRADIARMLIRAGADLNHPDTVCWMDQMLSATARHGNRPEFHAGTIEEKWMYLIG